MTLDKEWLLNPKNEVLIVDDSADYSSVLKRFLSQGIGFESVTVAPTLAEAHRLVAENPTRFSMFFLDYHFPNGETGGDLIDRLKRDGLFTGQVAFFITAEPAIEKAIEANHMGISGVVIKPFNSKKLTTLLEQVSRARELDDELASDLPG